MRAIQISEYGGPEVMKVSEVAMPSPLAGDVLVKVGAAGVNYTDVYNREGRYKRPLPFVLGQEGAGVIEKIGESGDRFGMKVGDPVAWAGVMGSYAEYAVIPAERLVKVPDGVDLETAAAVMLQGMTAHYLTYATYALKRGDTALVHAAAGGVGLLLTQMAAGIGARVIATVSTDEKAKLAREAGANEIILYKDQDSEAETKRLTGGKGVDVVYDGVGKTTFEGSLNCLRPRGMMVLYGASSGAVPPFDLTQLMTKGSLYVTRPTMGSYIATHEELQERAGAVLGWVKDGTLKVRKEHLYPLAEAAQAHIDLEGRKTTGKLLLMM
jgi:NADPH2:quinone reductase